MRRIEREPIFLEKSERKFFQKNFRFLAGQWKKKMTS
ncbi:hypothetical protein SAMN05444339_101348 [Loktanella atrilutea]|uniref:Uncharacterized protein n=1 Tax=Loktanella atrilutea TaxID=366533 RepID=A0A1M4TF00_LOKAT|nr:hypothetical protein SAMN05444339_101348 [Loktanella atrilutea]